MSSKKKSKSPKENSLVWSTICVIFSKLLSKLASAYRFPYRSRKLTLDLKSQKTISAHYYNDIIEHPNRQIRLSFQLGNNNSCVFSVKKFELHTNQFILTEIVNLNHREFHHLYKNRYYVANK